MINTVFPFLRKKILYKVLSQRWLQVSTISVSCWHILQLVSCCNTKAVMQTFVVLGRRFPGLKKIRVRYCLKMYVDYRLLYTHPHSFFLLNKDVRWNYWLLKFSFMAAQTSDVIILLCSLMRMSTNMESWLWCQRKQRGLIALQRCFYKKR